MGKRRKKGKGKGKGKGKAETIVSVGELGGQRVELHVRESTQAERLERRFTAAVGTPYRAAPVGADQSGDLAVAVAYSKLLAWGRHLDQNNGIAVACLDELVNRTVGAGIRVLATPQDASGRELPELVGPLTELWDEYSEAADTTTELSEPALERLEARAWFRDGECFGQHIAGRARGFQFDPNRVPYAYEVLESDWCPIDFDDPPRGFRLGVQLDTWRRPRAYAIYKYQQNDHWTGASTQAAITRNEIKRVRRENMAHIKFARRWPQTRGISIFAAALTAMFDLGHYMESERVAARVAASLTGFIRRDPAVFRPVDREGQPKQRELELQAGQIFDDLLPGEEVGAISLDRPNNALIEFRREIIRDICGAAGARYSPVARDYSGTYSSQRQELVEAVPLYDHLSTNYVRHGPRARRRRLIQTAILDGRLAVPAGATLRSISKARYFGPPLPWIDPLKEAQAISARVEAASALGVEPEQLRDVTPTPTDLEAFPS